jgi:hypothetical protein
MTRRLPRPWTNALAAAALGLVLLAAVAALTACSIDALPTRAATRALPTPRASKTAATRPATAPTAPAAPVGSALVLAYDYDPTTGGMVPAERLSGVTTRQQDHLWVMTDNAFVEYHQVAPDEMLAVKVITYTYDSIGRRVGWTVSWPQGPTATQQLTFLYEGLVAVGERLAVGGLVTTTYYPWAARDRNTTVDEQALILSLPITDATRYDPRCQEAADMDCETMLAMIVVSEASVGNEEEQRAVAWTFRNRLDRGLALTSYAMDQTPRREWYFELAREVLTSPPETDVTKGATHFFSPCSMPLQGQEARCKPNGIYNCDGGLVYVEGLDAPAYAPFWHLLYEWLPVEGIRKTHFLFYRIPPIRPRVGS